MNGKSAEVELEPLQTLTEPLSRRIHVYKKRWIILTVSCLIQFVDQIIFLSFAPVANYADAFYGENAVNNLVIICTAVSIPASIVAPWFGSVLGLKAVMLYPAWVNAVGSGLRLLSHVSVGGEPLSVGVRFALVAVGQALAASGTPFAVYQPSKIAGSWFPIDERAVAASICTISGMVGILFVNAVCPFVVQAVDGLLNLNILVAALTMATTLLTTAAVFRTATPPLPPSETAEKHLSFWKGLRHIFRIRAFIILVFVMGGAFGCFSALYTLMEQVMCSRGYSNQFSGLCISLLIGWGLVGAVLAGLAADRWKCFEEILKVSAALASLASIGIAWLAIRPGYNVELAVMCSVFGFFGMAFYGVAMDVGAEITHPVAETTSGGILILSGFVQFIVIFNVLQMTAGPLPPDMQSVEVCSVLAETGIDISAHDMTTPLLILSALICANSVFFIGFFRPTYARLEHENKKAAEQKLLLRAASEAPPTPSLSPR